MPVWAELPMGGDGGNVFRGTVAARAVQPARVCRGFMQAPLIGRDSIKPRAP